jgi:hypothetical protein
MKHQRNRIPGGTKTSKESAIPRKHRELTTVRNLATVVLTFSLLCACGVCVAEDAMPPIQKVEIGKNREFRVNGKPFFPIMGWLQDPKNLPKLKAEGMNSIAGYWRPKEGDQGTTRGADEYAEQARKAGLYLTV